MRTIKGIRVVSILAWLSVSISACGGGSQKPTSPYQPQQNNRQNPETQPTEKISPQPISQNIKPVPSEPQSPSSTTPPPTPAQEKAKISASSLAGAKLMTEKCSSCHSSHPQEPGFNQAPMGIAFDTEAQVLAQTAQIQSALENKRMPLKFSMTEAERTEMLQWLKALNTVAQPTAAPLLLPAQPGPQPPLSGATPMPLPFASGALPTSQAQLMSASTAQNPLPASGTLNGPQLIMQKCTYCHSAQPAAASGLSLAPMGLAFDSEAEILAKSALIQSAVSAQRMPIGLNMNTQERQTLLQWITQLSASAQAAPAPITPPTVQATPLPTPIPLPIIPVTSPLTPTTPVSNLSTALPSSPTVPASPVNTLASVDIMALVTPKCAYCHSAHPAPGSGYTVAPRGLSLDSEADLVAQLTRVKTYVQYDLMPIGGISLSSQEKTQLLNWQPVSSPTLTPSPNSNLPPLPTPTPLPPLTGPQLISAKCSYCHSNTPDPSSGYRRAAGEIVLDTETQMVAQKNKIYSVLKDTAMPPRNSAIQLSAQEAQTIKQWCQSLANL